MSRYYLIRISFALYSFLTLALSSTITPAPTPTSSYRDPLGGGTFRSGSINGTTTIWTAYYNNPSLSWDTAEGTVTDEVTSLIWSQTRMYVGNIGIYTNYRTVSCQMSSDVETWCTESLVNAVNGTTIYETNGVASGVEVSEFPVPTMTVSDGLLVPLSTNPVWTSILKPTSSSKINASPLYKAFEC
jgi:hypothetical protein